MTFIDKSREETEALLLINEKKTNNTQAYAHTRDT